MPKSQLVAKLIRSGRIGLYNNPLKNMPPVGGNGYGFFATLCTGRSDTGHSIEHRITNSPSETISTDHSLVHKLVIQMVKAVGSYA